MQKEQDYPESPGQKTGWPSCRRCHRLPQESKARTQPGAAGQGGLGVVGGAAHTSRKDRSQAEDTKQADKGVREQAPGGSRELGQDSPHGHLPSQADHEKHPFVLPRGPTR